ncbi:hypothetical protein H5410_028175 [Solanum commersonii]|uniref:Uncharacterized protein n=1 Tax=Solanum commersonii TaxID=4109 RepID=A0A9J5Z170_SOLCO|nr:hypothetical protein H5410_028175 [Solanum commersonii]
MFEYIHRYWTLNAAKSLENGCSVHADMWDITEENIPKNLNKTFFYNFFPLKDEEEACKLNNTPHVVTRELIEMRDIYPSSKIDLENRWQTKKKITRDEIIVRKPVRCACWCVGCNGGECPKKYQGGSFCLRNLYNDDFPLSCMELFNNCGFGDCDEIGIYWDPRSLSLMFQLLSPICA